MINIRPLGDTLESGRVTRYHAAPTVAPQGMAHHQWNVAMFVLFVTDHRCTQSLLTEALCHDTGEYVTGDIPFTLKRDYPELKVVLHKMELDARQGMLGYKCDLTTWEAAVLKVCDTLDGLWWTHHHESPGGPVHGRWIDAYNLARFKFQKDLTPDEWSRADRVFDYVGGRAS